MADEIGTCVMARCLGCPSLGRRLLHVITCLMMARALHASLEPEQNLAYEMTYAC